MTAGGLVVAPVLRAAGRGPWGGSGGGAGCRLAGWRKGWLAVARHCAGCVSGACAGGPRVAKQCGGVARGRGACGLHLLVRGVVHVGCGALQQQQQLYCQCCDSNGHLAWLADGRQLCLSAPNGFGCPCMWAHTLYCTNHVRRGVGDLGGVCGAAGSRVRSLPGGLPCIKLRNCLENLNGCETALLRRHAGYGFQTGVLAFHTSGLLCARPQAWSNTLHDGYNLSSPAVSGSEWQCLHQACSASIRAHGTGRANVNAKQAWGHA